MAPEESEITARSTLFRFAFWFGLGLTLLALIPTVFALLMRPEGAFYLGHQMSTDDHMVYAAWMRQAMDGQILFDNRFTTDAQPGLTFHVYFLALGWLAKLVGIPIAASLARAFFSFLFVLLLARLIARLNIPLWCGKLALVLCCLGGGVGFALWQHFGRTLGEDSPSFAKSVLGGLLPIDVWQTEAFVFPSMLTNSLFMVSLCLVLGVMLSALESKTGWKPVPLGALLMGLLMNIHSYDVLLLGFIFLGLLVMQIAQRDWGWQWIARCLVIGLGALPAALWFLYVLKEDPVFQARAATLTFSATFRQTFAGLLVPLLLGAFWLVAGANQKTAGSLSPENLDLAQKNQPTSNRGSIIAGALFLIMMAALFAFSGSNPDRFWLGLPTWCGVFGVALLCLCGLAGNSIGRNMVLAWAAIGLLSPYFPALFQRKLGAGLVIPWAILAALALMELTKNLQTSSRKLVLLLSILIISGTSVRWLQRELTFIRDNVASTVVHPVFLTKEAYEVVQYLNHNRKKRTVVLAMPGVPLPSQEPGNFASPYLPDLNPILSGLTGCYTFAGHWSETPDYDRRRAELNSKLFSARSTTETQAEILKKTDAEYVVMPKPEAFPQLPIADLTHLGKIALQNDQYKIIKVQK